MRRPSITFLRATQLNSRVGHSFLCSVIGGELRPNAADSVDARFFSLDALPPMYPIAFERLHQLLPRLAALVDRYPSLGRIKPISPMKGTIA